MIFYTVLGMIVLIVVNDVIHIVMGVVTEYSIHDKNKIINLDWHCI